MTYRQLRDLLNNMYEFQLDYNLTVENGFDDECYTAEVRIAGKNHATLEDGHPVIYYGEHVLHYCNATGKEIANRIGV